MDRVDRNYFWRVLGALNMLLVEHILTSSRKIRKDLALKAQLPKDTITIAPEWQQLLL